MIEGEITKERSEVRRRLWFCALRQTAMVADRIVG
eukprot:COSAG03_NODE_461_length_7711_cov_2.201787_5_plen_35_part_00